MISVCTVRLQDIKKSHVILHCAVSWRFARWEYDSFWISKSLRTSSLNQDLFWSRKCVRRIKCLLCNSFCVGRWTNWKNCTYKCPCPNNIHCVNFRVVIHLRPPIFLKSDTFRDNTKQYVERSAKLLFVSTRRVDRRFNLIQNWTRVRIVVEWQIT